ncbi:hypothetical protein KPB2_5530 [Klebsiella pneumoniae Kb677]|nr:hypothetical protein KPB2_5530 [Klebsiella pneumoniae Kb677]
MPSVSPRGQQSAEGSGGPIPVVVPRIAVGRTGRSSVKIRGSCSPVSGPLQTREAGRTPSPATAGRRRESHQATCAGTAGEKAGLGREGGETGRSRGGTTATASLTETDISLMAVRAG